MLVRLSSSYSNFARYFIIAIFCLLSLILLPLQGNAHAEQRSYLTLEILERKIKNPIQKEGKDTIDLSNYIIDLANLDGEYNQQFYQQINNAIVRSTTPLNFDFSSSIFQGDLQLDRLGINSGVGKGALSSIFTPSEQAQINQYYLIGDKELAVPRVNIFRGGLKFSNAIFTGKVNSSDSLFLQQFQIDSAKFQDTVTYNRVFFAEKVDFSQSVFEQNVNLNFCHFFASANFPENYFQGIVEFNNNSFEALVEFNNSLFEEIANLTHNVFIQKANFSNIICRDRLILAKSKFLDSLLLSNSTFEKNITLRNIYANSTISLQDAHLLNRIDLSNAFFTPQATINASGLAFDSTEAQIIGESGIIGQYIQINRLDGNETVLRNLIRNFRSLEQIADANFLEYQKERLLARQLNARLFKASWQKIFTWSWLVLIPQWLILNLLLLLGNYGTNINLLFSIGLVAIAWFSFLFWLIDRYRPYSVPVIAPTRYEITVMASSYGSLTALSLINILLISDRPGLTLMAVGIILLPIPIFIAALIYQQNRDCQLPYMSYFVENGGLREFRLLLGRLPIIPRFPFFRDRYQPLIWHKRWSWLNYYDFSLNNTFKLGFNDIRLRDRHLPGLVATLVWYQWCLGVFYVILLLWTLSRTIPGLNLLIYF